MEISVDKILPNDYGSAKFVNIFPYCMIAVYGIIATS